MRINHYRTSESNAIQVKKQLNADIPTFDSLRNPHDFQQLQHPTNGRIISISRREPDFIKRLMRCGYQPVGGER